MGPVYKLRRHISLTCSFYSNSVGVKTFTQKKKSQFLCRLIVAVRLMRETQAYDVVNRGGFWSASPHWMIPNYWATFVKEKRSTAASPYSRSGGRVMIKRVSVFIAYLSTKRKQEREQLITVNAIWEWMAFTKSIARNVFLRMCELALAGLLL